MTKKESKPLSVRGGKIVEPAVPVVRRDRQPEVPALQGRDLIVLRHHKLLKSDLLALTPDALRQLGFKKFAKWQERRLRESWAS